MSSSASGDAAALDARDEYDAVYARLLLTHLAEPEATLQRMIAAVKPDGVVIVEDLDHSALFAYPACPAVDRYVELYNEVARRRGGDPEIGPKVSGMLRRAGLDDVQLRLTQPVFMAGPPKRINQITLENVQDAILAAGLTTTDEIDAITTELEAFTDDPDTIVAFRGSSRCSAAAPDSPYFRPKLNSRYSRRLRRRWCHHVIDN